MEAGLASDYDIFQDEPPAFGLLVLTLLRWLRQECGAARIINMETENRITIEPGKLGGKPCIRGLRFTVYDLMSYLASGMTEEDILKEFPDLEKEDFQAVYDFFAHIPDKAAVL